MQTPENSQNVHVLQRLLDVGLTLSEERDLNRLLDKIASFALEISNCDACSIYVIREDMLEFMVARNLSLEAKQVHYPTTRFKLKLDSNTIAGHVAMTGEILNVPDVNELDDSHSFKFDRKYDLEINYESHSMLVVPLKDTRAATVGVMQLINHKQDGNITAFPGSILKPVLVMANQAGIALRNAVLSEALLKSQFETVYHLGMAAETRDNETGNHLKRMSRYARLIAREVGRDDEYQLLILNAAPLHDVGKIGIPDAILQKRGRLTDGERAIMNRHPEMGYQILAESTSPLLKLGANIALTHHEKWDGSGYPRRLSGLQIPLEGRITALADVFDALTTKRCYKDAWEFDEVLDYVRDQKAKHFDPEMVDLFLGCVPEIQEIFDAFRDGF